MKKYNSGKLYKKHLVFYLMLSLSVLFSYRAEARFQMSASCSRSEHWEGEDETEKNAARDLNLLISGKISPLQSFAQAVALRRSADLTPKWELFTEYWIARSLQEAGLIHLAHEGMGMVLTNVQGAPANQMNEQLVIQRAALGCLVAMKQQVPELDWGGVSVSQLKRLSQLENGELIWQAASLLPFETGVLQLVKGGGVYEDWVKLMIASHKNDYPGMIQSYRALATGIQNVGFFKPYLDHIKLLYARALFATGQWDVAVDVYQSVRSRSNEKIDALSETSWAYLREEKYRQAIGAGIGLQSGGLKQTFVPESMMVMAIALNEMCRFPESMNVIHSFRKNYFDSYEWLKKQNASHETSFYRQAVAFTKRDPGFNIPVRVAGQWIRSPLFIAKQESINLNFKELTLENHLKIQGPEVKKKQILALLQKARDLYLKFKKIHDRKKEVNASYVSLRGEVMQLREELTRYLNLKAALPVWSKVLDRDISMVPTRQKKAVAEIDQEIKMMNTQMLTALEEIEENVELVEIEIWNGASEDIVWQNAHPDYKDVVQKIKEKSDQGARGSSVWNWGKIEGGFNGQGEIWEDEVGSLSADLYDNCENKDKYLALVKR